MIGEFPCQTPSCSMCFKCDLDEFYHNGECINACPNGYNGNPHDRLCYACKLGCRVCTSDTDCSSCFAPMIALNNDCVNSCDTPGTYPNFQTGTCDSCLVNGCEDCLISFGISCISCFSPKMLAFELTSCGSSCPIYEVQRGAALTCQRCFVENCVVCD
jgi:hypothetical protein